MIRRVRAAAASGIFITYLPGFPLKAATSFHEGQRTIWPDGVLYQLTIAARGLWRHHHLASASPVQDDPGPLAGVSYSLSG